MMLVVMGLLFGLVGLLWVMVIHMVAMDHRHAKADSEDSNKPDSDRHEPKAA